MTFLTRLRLALCTSGVSLLLTSCMWGQTNSTQPVTVELRGPSGEIQPYQLKQHPRVWLDGKDGPITRALMDPDGNGPLRSSKASGFLWESLQRQAERWLPRASTAQSGTFAMVTALGWFMDHNAKLSNGTTYRDAALNQLRNVEEIWVGMGACDKAVAFCGLSSAAWPSTLPDYMGVYLNYWAIAYTIMREELTPEERKAFADKVLTGFTWDINGNCDNRLERVPGAFRMTLSGNGAVVSGTGTTWDSSMEGHWFYIKRVDESANVGVFVRPTKVNSGTAMTLEKPFYTAGFLDKDLHMYRIKPWASGQCGMGYSANHHGSVPAYVVQGGTTKLTKAISETDTEITITDTSILPSYLPAYITLGGGLTVEALKVTAIQGKTLTVTRSEFSTPARSWPVTTNVNYSSHVGRGDPMGWNNRTLTRQTGHILMALALADDDPRAVQLLKTTTNFWYTNTWFMAKNYFTLANSSLTAYGLTRVVPFFLWATAAYYNATEPALDFRGDWVKSITSDFYLHWTFPWDPNGLINWGVIATPCTGLGAGAELQCVGPAVWLLGLYPDSDAASYMTYWLKNRKVDQDTRMFADSAERTLLPMLLFWDPAKTGRDAKETLLPHIISTGTGDDDKDPTTNMSVVSSKTDWTPNATHLYVLAPDDMVKEFPSMELSDKVFDSYMADYGIGKQGWFLGQISDGVFMRYLGSQNTIDLGPVSRTAINPHTDLEIDWRKDKDRNLLAFRVDLKKGFAASQQVRTAYRYFVHFKPTGKDEHIVVYDSVGLNTPQRIRTMLHYPNNGQQGEGDTRVDKDSATLVTTNHSKGWMYTQIARVSGSGIVTDLNATAANNRAVIGSYCSTANPCVARIGSRLFQYDQPSTITATPSPTATSEIYVWLDPNSGKLQAAPNNTEMQCTGLLECSTDKMNDFPDDVLRVARLTWSRGSLTSGCPGLATASRGSEYNLCVGGNERHVFLDAGPRVRSADFLVVHEPRLAAGTPAPTRTIPVTEGFTAVQIEGGSPKVAVFPVSGDSGISVDIQTSHEGVAQYAVAGMQPGVYEVTRNGAVILQDVQVQDKEYFATFEAESGLIKLRRVREIGAIAIADGKIERAAVDTPFTFTLRASGGTPPYQWEIVSGSLPVGLTLDPAGIISGTPTEAGKGEITVRLTDANGLVATGTLSWTVEREEDNLHITSAALAGGIVGASYSTVLTAAGGTPPYEWTITDGSLPDGLTLNQETGEISGEPKQPGKFSFEVQVVDDRKAVSKTILLIDIASPAGD